MQQYEDLALVAQVVRHALADQADLAIERVGTGVSTAVYRVAWAETVLYVRVLPEQGASFAPEAAVHRLLRARGLRVPEVVYVEALNPLLQRSVMFTTAIAGRPLGYGQRPAQVAAIVREAGRELAVLNQVTVQGFGWMLRDSHTGEELSAEYATQQEWLAQHVAPAVALLSQEQ